MPLIKRHSQPSGLPASAPVHEFICLFTHDLKRKQKRWQDGRLKFHTFNKRIMVYDERGNFIGDMHWNEDFAFGEGEEFNLERGAVIVQVAECIGTKDQDLTDLLDKRARDRQQQQQQQRRRRRRQQQHQAQQQPHPHFKQRHLADVFNTPRGPQGRAAIPTTSPYEDRIAAQAPSSQDEDARPAKRRKRDVSPPSKSGYAQNLFGTTLTLSSWSASASIRSQPLITPINEGSRSARPVRAANIAHEPLPAAVDLTIDAHTPSKTSSTRAFQKHQAASGQPSGIRKTKAIAVVKPCEVSQADPVQRVDQLPRSSDEFPISTEHPREKGTQSQKPDRFTIDEVSFLASTMTGDMAPSLRETQKPKNKKAHHSGLCSGKSSTDSKPSQRSTEDAVREGEWTKCDVVSTIAIQPDTPDEPKAKLRIKSRQKRGLLMVSNMSNRATSRSPADYDRMSELDATTDRMTVACKDTSLVIPRVSCSPNIEQGDDLPVTAKDQTTRRNDRMSIDLSRSGDGNDGLQQRCEGQNDNQWLQTSRDMDTTTLPDAGMVCRHSRGQGGQSMRDAHQDTEAWSVHVGPRLASLGRRSVKSKEIIGSFDQRQSLSRDQSSEPELGFFQEVNKLKNERAPRFSNNEGINILQSEVPKSTKGARLVNPATRGRKAATKSDAAGAVPQSFISANSSLTPPSVTASKPDSDKDTGPEEADTSTVHLPGFSKANGGPWSREAYDLLGCARPG
uniref:5'-3' DNA helicase ZGRF1-like N-terminal domain-containing protein n=1 Tax=Colletotrichum fructicola (strain Nara gc5) TaxID=1213859 RepID=L2FKM4_COLFN